MGALLDLASLDKQPMEVAPSFYPEGELREAVKVEVSSLLELLGDIWHVVQRGLLLNRDCLSLPGSEVVKEAFPHLSPLSLPEGGLYGVFVVDLEHMLKVPSPPTTAVFHSHLCWTGVSGSGTMASWDWAFPWVVVEGALVVISWPHLGRLADLPLMPHPLACCLPRSGMVWSGAGAAQSEIGWANNPLPVDLLGSCTACWYGVAGWLNGCTACS